MISVAPPRPVGATEDRPLLYAFWWHRTGDLQNLGDYLTVPVLEGLGYDVRRWAADAFAPDGDARPPCVLAVGSALSGNKYATIGSREFVVWGTGAGYDMWGLMGERWGLRMSFRAVRGPLTRDLLGLPADTPLGDPAVLLPMLHPRESLPPPSERGGVLYIPQWEEPPGLRPHGTEETLSPLVSPTDWRATVARIASADFVLASSLHGAILAQAYGVPWAPAVYPHERRPERMRRDNLNRFKWADWFRYLGLRRTPLRFVGRLDEGERWWRENGPEIVVPDRRPLLDAFPHDAAVPAAARG